MRGRLKIFLGYAAGVGKTSAMLEAAQRRRTSGVDVLAAWVQTDAAELLEGIEIAPLRSAGDDGRATLEMDPDAVLRCRPQLALVDDLAHANPQGARHPKRIQDVEDFLEAGIDVYATLNIQNVASLTDIVQQITGERVDETVPDSLLDEADELELVDLPVEELLERLRTARGDSPLVETFLRKGNLTALREMAMRRVAMRVDDQMRGYMAEKSIAGPWAAGERVLVAISSHPLGERLVRAGRRLADSLNAEWIVVFIETPGHLSMSAEQRGRLLETLDSAEEMGARAVTLSGERVTETLMEFAQRENITHLVIGRPARADWLDFWGMSLVDQILRASGSIQVFVVGGGTEHPRAVPLPLWNLRSVIVRYVIALGLVAGVTVAGLPIARWVQPVNLVMLYLAAVMACGAYWGRGPAILAAAASGLAFAFFFNGPALSFTPEDFPHLITFAGLLIAGLVVAELTAMLRGQVRASRRREEEARALNALSRDLTIALGLEDMLNAVVRNVSLTFGREAAVLLPEGEQLAVNVSSPGLTLDAEGMEAAQWAYAHRKPSGRGTDTFAGLQVRCLPLETREGVVGVLAVAPREPGRLLSPEQRALLEGFASLAALAIERARLSEQASQAAVLRTTERLQTALLNSISHDLRTPLSTITGAVTSLLETEQNGSVLDHEARLDLLENASDEAERLNRLVGNLLDMTRLEAGAMKMKRAPCDVQDVIGAALQRASRRLAERPVETNIPADLPAIQVDFVLMVQVLFNLLDNAAKYSPAGTAVEISARGLAAGVEIRVTDHGLGIPAEDLERVFGKFYRVQRSDGVPGTGLGLSICRGIVEAHGGKIWAENRPEGGTAMILLLPVNEEEEKVNERR